MDSPPLHWRTAGRSRPSIATAALQDEPVAGGTLREGYDLDFSRMDPVGTNWYDPAFSALYENVITNDPEGAKVPQIAESWEFSEDGTVLTFKIRTGLSFHSGDVLDAAAVAAAFTEIKTSGSLAVFFEPVETIEATDETTVVLTMSHPVLRRDQRGRHRLLVDLQQPGPRRARRRRGRHLRTATDRRQRTLHLWRMGARQPRDGEQVGRVSRFDCALLRKTGPAYLDGIRWEFISEAAQRAIRIENGEIDTLRGPAAQDIARLEGNSDLNVVRLQGMVRLHLRGQSPAKPNTTFQEVRMRQAMSGAINRQAIADALLFGEGEPIYGPITTADRYYTPEVEQFNQFDLDQSKAWWRSSAGPQATMERWKKRPAHGDRAAGSG